jgi:hypothetical protein
MIAENKQRKTKMSKKTEKAPKTSKQPKAEKAPKAPKVERLKKPLTADIELYVELKDVPSLEKLLTNDPAKREKVMELMTEAFTDRKDQTVLKQLYLALNEGLTEKLVLKAIEKAHALEKKSKIRTCYIEHNGEMVSVKDVYRIACADLGYDLTNKDFTTWDAIDELRFFVEVNWMPEGADKEHYYHDRTILPEA